MTQDNSIFHEVDEDLERQRLEAVWREYGPWIIAAAMVFIIATAGYASWHSWKIEKQQKHTGALIDIMTNSATSETTQVQSLEELAHNSRGSIQSAFAQIQAGTVTAQTGDSKKAIAIFDAVAADTKVDSAFRQFADLLSVQEQMNDEDPVALQQRLQPLLAVNAPWRFTAAEDAAFLALRAGDKAKARQLFNDLSKDPDAPPAMSERATDMARFLDE